MFNERVEHFLSQILATTLILASFAGTILAREGDVRQNLDLMQLLSERVAATVAAQIGDRDSIQTTVLPRERAWYVEASIVRGFSAHGFPSSASATARYSAEFGQKALRVVYGDVERDGFFGEKVVSRTVQVTLSAKVVDHHSGRLLLMQDVSEETTDTIGLSQIQQVENPTISVTQGKVPAEGFFTNLVEPLVVLGSIAVAVYLLFHVRS